MTGHFLKQCELNLCLYDLRLLLLSSKLSWTWFRKKSRDWKFSIAFLIFFRRSHLQGFICTYRSNIKLKSWFAWKIIKVLGPPPVILSVNHPPLSLQNVVVTNMLQKGTNICNDCSVYADMLYICKVEEAEEGDICMRKKETGKVVSMRNLS